MDQMIRNVEPHSDDLRELSPLSSTEGFSIFLLIVLV